MLSESCFPGFCSVLFLLRFEFFYLWSNKSTSWQQVQEGLWGIFWKHRCSCHFTSHLAWDKSYWILKWPLLPLTAVATEETEAERLEAWLKHICNRHTGLHQSGSQKLRGGLKMLFLPPLPSFSHPNSLSQQPLHVREADTHSVADFFSFALHCLSFLIGIIILLRP